MNRSALFMCLMAVACTGPKNDPRGFANNGIVVIDSDYKSTAVSLVDPSRTALAQDDCLDSGAVSPALSLALSGDVVVASRPVIGGSLLLIDRTNAALDFIAPKSCTVQSQFSVGQGFAANPHDVVSLSALKAYVTRYDANGGVGDDVAIVNPLVGSVTGTIPLSNSATRGHSRARPDRALAVLGKVYVVLGEVSDDFKTTGTGAVAILDPANDSVVGKIDLAPYKSCSGLDVDVANTTLFVGCSGDLNDTLANQLAQSAIVLIDVAATTPSIKRTIAASALGGRPIQGSGFAVAGDKLVVATTFGDFAGTTPDALWAVPLDGQPVKLADGASAGVYGSVVWDARAERVYSSDAPFTGKPRVHVYDVSKPSAVVEVTSFDANPRSGLPPRALAWY